MKTAQRLLSDALIQEKVIEAIGKIFCDREPHAQELLTHALESETDELARDILDDIIDNAALAREERLPLCQDTGLLVVFARLGVDARLESCLRDTLEQAAAIAWQKYYMRDSIAPDPLRGQLDECEDIRSESDARLPIVLHLEQVRGDGLSLDLALKGGGAENMSAMRMFNPSAKVDEIVEFVVDTVVNAGGRPCPPVIVGVGIGGDFELSAILAKRALFTDSDERGTCYRELEKDILRRINERGSGVMGLAGGSTALEVRILTAPCHIASLPVAVNLDCHAHRHIRVEI